jgi:predicted histone-like DNA-binding protein
MDAQNDNLRPEGSRKSGLYPRIVSKKTVGLEDLCQHAARGTTLNAFELEIAAKLIVERILKELRDGNNVTIDRFGTFSVSAEAIRKAQDPKDIRAESIRLKKIVFKTSTALPKSSFKFQRLAK